MTVSRNHATIDLSNLAPGCATIENLDSLNGTWVDGTIINKATLRDGSTIQIGTFHGLPTPVSFNKVKGWLMADSGFLTIGR